MVSEKCIYKSFCCKSDLLSLCDQFYTFSCSCEDTSLSPPAREKKTSLGSPTKGGKKAKKKNPWSDSEGSDNISDISDLEDDSKFKSDVVIPRETSRRAAGELL